MPSVEQIMQSGLRSLDVDSQMTDIALQVQSDMLRLSASYQSLSLRLQEPAMVPARLAEQSRPTTGGSPPRGTSPTSPGEPLALGTIKYRTTFGGKCASIHRWH